MNIVFYMPDQIKVRERFYRVVEMAETKAKTEVFRDIRDLSYRLSRSSDADTIAVLLVITENDLNNLVLSRHLFSDIPLILILPYREIRTTSIGYRLGPRFLTYMDVNVEEVAAVLEKMIQNYRNKKLRK